MAKRLISLMLCVLTLLTLAACAGDGIPDGTPDITTASGGTVAPAPGTTAAEAPNTTAPATDAPVTSAVPHIGDAALPEYSVLFIGNSYTYYNDMHVIFRELVQSAGGKVSVTKLTNGGHTLKEFASDSDEYGKQVNVVIKKKFDIVFLQEQSLRPATSRELFYDGVRELCAKIQPYGSKIYLFETWGRKAGSADLIKYSLTTAEMEAKLRQAYAAIGEELGLPVSYAGVAMLDVYTNHPEIELYNSDRTHPSPAGSYLAACVHFATLYGVSPVGIEFTGGLDAATAGILQTAAEKVMTSDPASGVEKISSVGVTSVKQDALYGVDITKTVNLTTLPTGKILTVVDGDFGSRKFSGLLGDKGVNSSSATGTSLTAEQLAELADISYGVSLIGAASMPSTTKSGSTFTGLGALCNGHWGSSWMATWTFGSKKYDVGGNEDANGRYVGLITLNFGKKMIFDSLGYYSGSLQGFPQVADVFVSDDGINWVKVPSACYDAVAMLNEGKALANAGQSPGDPWQSNSAKVSAFFSMNGASGKYIRIGVILGRGDPVSLSPEGVQDINTRELAVYGREA